MSLYGGVTLPGGPDLENVRRLDLLPVPTVAKMHRYGIAIDVPYLHDLSSQLGKEMADLQKDIASYIPKASLDQFTEQASLIEESHGNAALNANSAVQIRDLLLKLNINFGNKPKLTSAGAVSTGKKSLELWKEQHPVIQAILDYKERSKLKSAFADSLPTKARHHPRGDCSLCGLRHVESTWRVHTQFLMTRTETGRFASKGPNLQQIPARTTLGRMIRRAFLASPGKRLVSTDFAQIELRDLAHCADAASMIDVYQQDMDIHLYTACRTFNRDYAHYARLSNLKELGQLPAESKADWLDFSLNCRLPSKNVNFMIVYGATGVGLQAQLALSGVFWTEEQCDKFIDLWFTLYPEVWDYMDLQRFRARKYGFVWDVFGRVRRVPEIYSAHSYVRSAGLRQAGNMPIQATSAGQTKLVMAELEEDFSNIYSDGRGPFVWPLLTIHDQLVIEGDEEIAEDCRDIMMGRFSEVMIDKETGENTWKVPIKSDGEILTRWEKE